MNKTQIRQQLKNECLNRIRHIFSPNWKYDSFWSTKMEDQRDQVQMLIEQLERELKQLENKTNETDTCRN